MNFRNTYICSVCGGTCMGAGTCDKNGSFKTDEGGYCPFCRKEMLDTGIRFLEYTSLSAKDPNYDQQLIDTIVIPYGKFNPSERSRTLIKMRNNGAFADSLHRNISASYPTCPTCGSKNIRKISGIERVVSVGFLGLASSKIGKTNKCNNCDSTW